MLLSLERGENIAATFSRETIGWYSSQPGGQHYPFPLNCFHPLTGNLFAIVSNLCSHSLLYELIAGFRRHAAFQSKAVAASALLPGVNWSDHWSFWKEDYSALMVTVRSFTATRITTLGGKRRTRWATRASRAW